MPDVIVNGTCYDKVKPEENPFLTIELSKDAARALHLVLSHVGGCPTTTGRKYLDSIYKALVDLGSRTHDSEDFVKGNITFLDRQ